MLAAATVFIHCYFENEEVICCRCEKNDTFEKRFPNYGLRPTGGLWMEFESVAKIFYINEFFVLNYSLFA